VDEVELGVVEQVLERARHVQRQGHRAAAPERERLADGEHRSAPRLVEHGIEVGADVLHLGAPLANQFARIGGCHHDDPMPALAELVGEALHEAVDLVVLLPWPRGDLGDRERHSAQDTSAGSVAQVEAPDRRPRPRRGA
jgi:hypothetical protein